METLDSFALTSFRHMKFRVSFTVFCSRCFPRIMFWVYLQRAISRATFRGILSRLRSRPKSLNKSRVIVHVKFDLKESGGHASFYWAHWVSRVGKVCVAHVEFVNGVPRYHSRSHECRLSRSPTPKTDPLTEDFFAIAFLSSRPRIIARCGR